MRLFRVLWQCSRKKEEELERLGCPRSVPWSLVAPHEAQALRNHEQTLERLNERGGLSPAELVAVLTGLPIRAVLEMSSVEAVPVLLRLIKEHAEEDRENGV